MLKFSEKSSRAIRKPVAFRRAQNRQPTRNGAGRLRNKTCSIRSSNGADMPRDRSLGMNASN